MPLIQFDDLERLVVAIYVAAGAPVEHARTVSRHQVGSDLAGHDSHGIIRLPTYVQGIDNGHIVPTARPVAASETSSTLVVNGQWGFGPVVSEWTMERCMTKARDRGLAAATVYDQSHVGRLADYPLLAARAGLIAFMMCDSGRSPKTVAPYGGREPRLGTNPLCIAFPSDLPGPIFIDMATSAAARGKILVALAKGEPVPPGWILDKHGRATTDPNALLDGGVMLPLGGAEGHKGYALSFAVETLAAVLSGLGFGIDPRGKHNDGAFMLVVDPALFRPLSDFKRDIAAFVRFLQETPPAEGFDEVLYPGEIEYRTEQRRRKEGIPIGDETWQKISDVAARFGLSITLPR